MTEIMLVPYQQEVVWPKEDFTGDFIEGWHLLTPLKKGCVIGGAGATALFAAGAFLFAGLALKEGKAELAETGNAPIIGHFSEWTMLGIGSVFAALKIPRAIATRGAILRGERHFAELLRDESFARGEIIQNKEEFLESKRGRGMFYICELPKEDRLAVCDEIEKEINGPSILERAKRGWHEINKDKTDSARAVNHIAAVVSALFLIGITANYLFGIEAAGKQAISDFNEGVNPSIGGHCLEWTGEVLWIGMIVGLGVNALVGKGNEMRIREVFGRYEGIRELEKRELRLVR